ncbi:IS200/IS605 family transposase [Citrobacter portucalensis]|uniref:IS200/IS605 family transposase n=1 Tax=Citrobacter portucalensis TaxID=1639133 RepID=UPI003BEF2F3F
MKHIQLVFVTNYRRQIFNHDAIEKLRTYFSNVCADFEAELVEMDVEQDHVHSLINYPPKLAISCVVNNLKGVSSRYCCSVLLQRCLWRPSYFASSCGGEPIYCTTANT